MPSLVTDGCAQISSVGTLRTRAPRAATGCPGLGRAIFLIFKAKSPHAEGGLGGGVIPSLQAKPSQPPERRAERRVDLATFSKG